MLVSGFHGRVPLALRKFNIKENAMPHLTNYLLIVGALVLIFSIVMAVRAYLENRREEAAPFRNYFGSEYDRELLQRSSFSETEDWPADRDARFTPFRLRDPGDHERR
jgi:hypothetical protein